MEVPFARSGPPGWGPSSARWRSPLSGRRAVAALATLLGVAVVFLGVFVLGAVLVSLVRAEPPSAVAVGLALLAGTSGAMLLGLWAFVVAPLGGRWDLVGWRPPARSMWHLLWQIPALLGSALLAELVLAAPFLGGESASDGGGVEDLVAGHPLGTVALAVVLVCGIVPVWEELVFRGVLFGVLRTRLSRWFAVAVAGAVFGAIHFLPPAFPYLAVMGVGLCLLAEWYRSVIPGIVVHSVNNALVVVSILATVGTG